MASPSVLVNRAKMNVSGTPGTGTITLSSAVSGYQTFATAGIADGNLVSYVIEDGANWEIGQGTYTASGTTLARTTVNSSSAGGTTKISATASALVSLTALASDFNITGSPYTLASAAGGTQLTVGTGTGSSTAPTVMLFDSTFSSINGAHPKVDLLGGGTYGFGISGSSGQGQLDICTGGTSGFSFYVVGTLAGSINGGNTGPAGQLQFPLIQLDSGTKTAAATAGAATLNKSSGKITTEALTTAAGLTYTLTLTNSQIAAADMVFASVAFGTSTTGDPLVMRITPAAGSVVILVKNDHASAVFNGTLVISYMTLKA